MWTIGEGHDRLCAIPDKTTLAARNLLLTPQSPLGTPHRLCILAECRTFPRKCLSELRRAIHTTIVSLTVREISKIGKFASTRHQSSEMLTMIVATRTAESAKYLLLASRDVKTMRQSQLPELHLLDLAVSVVQQHPWHLPQVQQPPLKAQEQAVLLWGLAVVRLAEVTFLHELVVVLGEISLLEGEVDSALSAEAEEARRQQDLQASQATEA